MKIVLLEFSNLPIEKQLEIEKKLLKEEAGSFCLINSGSPPAIVLGASNHKEEHVDLKYHQTNPLPIIQRFSGGGSVVVDENTLFISFIIEKKVLDFSFPEQLFAWSESFYRKVFNLKNFTLKERDYLIGNRKCGGNAQYFTRKKWLHHTSFLLDFKEELMRYLLFPPKTPAYRKNRSHLDFMTKIKDYFSSKEAFLLSFKEELQKEFA